MFRFMLSIIVLIIPLLTMFSCGDRKILISNNNYMIESFCKNIYESIKSKGEVILSMKMIRLKRIKRQFCIGKLAMNNRVYGVSFDLNGNIISSKSLQDREESATIKRYFI